jgi:hypothetical protein
VRLITRVERRNLSTFKQSGSTAINRLWIITLEQINLASRVYKAVSNSGHTNLALHQHAAQTNSKTLMYKRYSSNYALQYLYSGLTDSKEQHIAH